MAIYMHIKGIDGSVTAENHENWIEMASIEWGGEREIAMGTGRSGDREVGTPTVSEVSLTKLMDRTSPLLFQMFCNGVHDTVTLHLVRTGTEALKTYMAYIFEECMVSSYLVTSAGDRPSESLKLSYVKLTMKYTPYDNNGKMQSPVMSGYDLSSAKKI